MKSKCHEDEHAHQNPYEYSVPTPKHAAKIDKKTRETEHGAAIMDYFCEILTNVQPIKRGMQLCGLILQSFFFPVIRYMTFVISLVI
jgi:hypothetical protein